jgi:hypothetical protein
MDETDGRVHAGADLLSLLLYRHWAVRAHPVLQQANPAFGVDGRSVQVVGQGGLGQTPIASPSAAVAGELVDGPFDPVALMHRLTECVRVHLATTRLQVIVVLAHEYGVESGSEGRGSRRVLFKRGNGSTDWTDFTD